MAPGYQVYHAPLILASQDYPLLLTHPIYVTLLLGHQSAAKSWIQISGYLKFYQWLKPQPRKSGNPRFAGASHVNKTPVSQAV